jgi:hypothetical protein
MRGNIWYLYDIFAVFIYENSAGMLVSVKDDNENNNYLKSLNMVSFTRT